MGIEPVRSTVAALVALGAWIIAPIGSNGAVVGSGRRERFHPSSIGRLCRRTLVVLGLVAVTLTAVSGLPSDGLALSLLAEAACDPPVDNAVYCENQLTGDPRSEWDVSGSGDPTIQGFATDISVNRGATVRFKISTPASDYRLDIYRLGYYGGMGARHVATVSPSATLPQAQPACLGDSNTGLVDCGNWAVSASWPVPATAVSGIYVAKAIRTDTGGASHIVFIVRDDAGGSDLLFQTSDSTWQAYNSYGGNSLYTGAPVGRAYKVSYNRPFNDRANAEGHEKGSCSGPSTRWFDGSRRTDTTSATRRPWTATDPVRPHPRPPSVPVRRPR